MMTEEKTRQILDMIIVADLDPEMRLVCEGIVATKSEEMIDKLAESLRELIEKKELAFERYKGQVKRIAERAMSSNR